MAENTKENIKVNRVKCIAEVEQHQDSQRLIFHTKSYIVSDLQQCSDSTVTSAETGLKWGKKIVRKQILSKLFVGNVLQDFGEKGQYGYWSKVGERRGIGNFWKGNDIGMFPSHWERIGI